MAYPKTCHLGIETTMIYIKTREDEMGHSP